MTLSDADYADLKRRLAKDTLSVNVLHVTGDMDALHVIPRKAFRIGQGSYLWSGAGVPNAALGNNHDYYFRTDGGSATHLYFKASGSWSAVV